MMAIMKEQQGCLPTNASHRLPARGINDDKVAVL